jgi:hypothetical protein
MYITNGDASEQFAGGIINAGAIHDVTSIGIYYRPRLKLNVGFSALTNILSLKNKQV